MSALYLLFLLIGAISKYCLVLENNFITFDFVLAIVNCQKSKEEIYALTRDGLSRENPDELLSGFFPVWPLILLGMSGMIFKFSIIISVSETFFFFRKLFCNEHLCFLWLCYR